MQEENLIGQISSVRMQGVVYQPYLSSNVPLSHLVHESSTGGYFSQEFYDTIYRALNQHSYCIFKLLPGFSRKREGSYGLKYFATSTM